MAGILQTAAELAGQVFLGPTNTGMDINSFRNNLNAGGDPVAMSQLFDVTITLPPIVSGLYSAQQLALSCESAEFPAADVNVIPYRHYGFTKYLPHFLSYTPLTTTFYVTGDMAEKNLFDAWINAVINRSGNGSGLVQYRMVGNQRQYETDVYINQYDRAGNLIYWAQALDAFPTSMSALMTNWGDDNIHRLTISWHFTKWLTAADGVTASPPSRPASNFVQQYASEATVYGQQAVNNILPPLNL